jgi:peptidoglycan/LPS O-acetylase OafA/YrhL
VRSEPPTRGLRHWWRSQSPPQRYGRVHALPYIVGGIVAYLFVVLGSSRPDHTKWALVTLPLLLLVVGVVFVRALQRWPRRWRLLIWTYGLAVLVPFLWWAGTTLEDRVTNVLGAATGWSLVLVWCIRQGVLEAPYPEIGRAEPELDEAVDSPHGC